MDGTMVERIKKRRAPSLRHTLFLIALITPGLLSPSFGYAQSDDPATAEAEDAQAPEKKKSEIGKEILKGLFKGLLRKGKIESVEVAQRRGNSITIGVSYRKVKISKDVHLTAEVMLGGELLQGFQSTVADIDDDRGRATITITWTDVQEGLEKESDQIKVIMFRGDDATDAMKTKSLDLKKYWTASVEESSDIVITDEDTSSETVGEGSETSTSKPEPTKYTYTAYTAANVRRSGHVRAGSLTWRCSGQRCTITGPWFTPGVGACNALARQVGRIRYYGHPGKRLTNSQLGQCNRGVVTASTITTRYTYTAYTSANVRRSGHVRAANLTWRCAGNRCTITGPWSRPSVNACYALARQVGRIRYYGHPGRRLTGSQLGQCNRGVSRTIIIRDHRKVITKPVVRSAPAVPQPKGLIIRKLPR